MCNKLIIIIVCFFLSSFALATSMSQIVRNCDVMHNVVRLGLCGGFHKELGLVLSRVRKSYSS